MVAYLLVHTPIPILIQLINRVALIFLLHGIINQIPHVWRGGDDTAKRLQRIEQVYELFTEKSRTGQTMTFDEMVASTGWKPNTVRTYLRKQWESFVREVSPGIYEVSPEVQTYPLDVFIRINSQKFRINKDPFKPKLTQRTEELISKSRESALLAVQVYNNPMMGFRMPSFIVHMIIAFTALFHAVFEEANIDSFYKDAEGQPLPREDGQPKLWDIRECIKRYWGDDHPATRKNLELFVALRDEVEHRYAPVFDPLMSGECQALLLNYERIVVEEFSPYYSLGANISIPLQISSYSNKEQLNAMRELQRHDYKILKDYVQSYRDALDPNIYTDPEYSFRVFLVQVPANRDKTADMTMEFIPYNESTREQIDALERGRTLIKTRTVPVANQGTYRPKDVVKVIQEVEPRFRMHEHTLAWKYFGVRQSGLSATGCKTEYCQYDEPHRDYVYTQKWVDLLTKAVTNSAKYDELRSYKPD